MLGVMGAAQPGVAATAFRCRSVERRASVRAFAGTGDRLCACARAVSPTSGNWGGNFTFRPSIVSTSMSDCWRPGRRLDCATRAITRWRPVGSRRAIDTGATILPMKTRRWRRGWGFAYPWPGTSPLADLWAGTRCLRNGHAARCQSAWCRSCCRTPRPRRRCFTMKSRSCAMVTLSARSSRGPGATAWTARSAWGTFMPRPASRVNGCSRAIGKSRWRAAAGRPASSCNLGTIPQNVRIKS